MQEVGTVYEAADSYDLITQSNNDFDVYTLLPLMWQAMGPAEKKAAIDIVQRYEKMHGTWNVAMSLCKLSM